MVDEKYIDGEYLKEVDKNIKIIPFGIGAVFKSNTDI